MVDHVRALHLDEVSGILDDQGRSQARHQVAHGGHRVAAEHLQDRVGGTGDEGGRYFDGPVVQILVLRPHQIFCPIPIEAAGESCPREFCRVVVEIRLGKPVPRQGRRVRKDVQIPVAFPVYPSRMIPAIQIAVGAAESMEQRGQERLWLRVHPSSARPGS